MDPSSPSSMAVEIQKSYDSRFAVRYPLLAQVSKFHCGNLCCSRSLVRFAMLLVISVTNSTLACSDCLTVSPRIYNIKKLISSTLSSGRPNFLASMQQMILHTLRVL